jgi:DNA-binding LacI/PurR family transcriptional regulator
MQRIIQKDIAAALGLHVSTVSKALKGDPAVASATVARVRAKAAEMGFVPDPMMGALAAYRSAGRPEAYRATLAWVHNHGRSVAMDRFSGYADYYEGAAERARELGYRLDPFWVEAAAGSVAALERVLEARGIRGAIFAPQAVPGRALGMDWTRYATVAIGYTVPGSGLDRVTNDHFATMTDLLEAVRARGYGRIGCHLWEVDNERMGRRARSAFLSVSRELNVRVKSFKRFEASSFLAWVARNRFDLVIGRGAEELAALRASGIAVPDAMGVAGYALPEDEVALSGMYHNNRRIGAAAVEWVSGKLQRGQLGPADCPHRLLVAGRWLENGSLR